MMICPMSVYDELKDKSIEEIKSAIRGFKQTIGKLKKKIEKERFFPAEVYMCPSDDVVLSCTREFLEMAIKALEEKGVKFQRSQAVLKSLNFIIKLSEVDEIRLRIGAWCSPHRYCFNIAEQKVKKYMVFTCEDAELDASYDVDVDSFLYSLSELHLGEWKSYYSPSKFGVNILDGIQWCVGIKFRDGTKRMWSGDNDYPYNFDKLLELLELNDIVREE